MDFWNDIVTEKSWKILQDLKGFNLKSAIADFAAAARRRV